MAGMAGSSRAGHSYKDIQIDGGTNILGDYYANAPTLRERHEENLRQFFRGTANPQTDREEHLILKDHRVEGTCKWIEDHSDFQSWKHGTEEPLLWISGGPGRGKTFLSMYIAETLKKSTSVASTRGKEHITLEFYCNNRHESRNTAVAILKGLILNFLHQSKDAVEHLLEVFESSNEAVSDLSRFGSLWKIFRSMLNDKRISRIYCILDGLDECSDDSFRYEIVQRLKDVASEQTTSQGIYKISILFTSRQMARSISTVLSSGLRIQLDQHQDNDEVVSALNQDLRQLINVKMDKYYPRKSYPDESWRSSLVEDLLRRSEGTFLWIGFAMEVIKDLNPDEILGALDQLPGDLPRMYARILSQILPLRRPIVKSILHWVLVATRPLSLLELYEATATKKSASSIRNATSYDEDRALKHMTEWVGFCANLLVIDKTKAVTFVHQSVKDYLFRELNDDDEEDEEEDPDPFRPPRRVHKVSVPKKHDVNLFRFQRTGVNLLVTRECICYIQRTLHDDITLRDTESRNEIEVGEVQMARDTPTVRIISKLYEATRSNPLLEYAVLHWADHAKLAGDDVCDVTLPFLAERSGSRDFWLREYDIANGKKDHECALSLKVELETWKSKPSDDVEPSSNPLHIAARIGLSSLVSVLIEKHRQDFADLPNVTGRAKYLEARTKWGNTALMFAARYGHPEVVQLLLDNGANINVRNKYALSPLLIAGYTNQLAVIDLLLKYGAGIGLPVGAGDVQTAWPVVVQGYRKIIEYLSSTGQDISARMKARDGRIPLLAAVEREDHSLVELLLQNGAETDQRNSRGDSVLSVAAGNEDLSLVKLLLNWKAEIESRNNAGETPLIVASTMMLTWRRRQCIDALIDHGANIEARDSNHDTALLICARMRYLSNMRHLVARGADIEARDANDSTALMIFPLGKLRDELNARIQVAMFVIPWNRKRKSEQDESYDRIGMARFLVSELTESRRRKFVNGSLSDSERQELLSTYADLNDLEADYLLQVTSLPSWI